MNQRNEEEQWLREFNDGYAKDIALGMSWYKTLNNKTKSAFTKRVLELIAANTPDGWEQKAGPGLEEVEGAEQQVKAYMIYKLASVGLTTLIWLVKNETDLPEIPAARVQSPSAPPEVSNAIQSILEWMARKKLDTIRFTAMDSEINGKVVMVLAAAIGDKCKDLLARTDRVGRDGGNEDDEHRED